jgi:AsmA protein
MELVALDLWDAMRVKMKGDKEVDIRCMIADFGVKGGVAQANALVFDTTVVNISGGGTVNLKTEEMDLTLKPQPKDRSIGSLRSPLHIRGTFGEPDVGPDMGRLAARGAGAIVMGILNPLLAVLPIIEEGKGKDSPCAELIAQATKSGRAAKAPAKPAPPTAEATSSDRSSASGATAPRPPLRPAR